MRPIRLPTLFVFTLPTTVPRTAQRLGSNTVVPRKISAPPTKLLFVEDLADRLPGAHRARIERGIELQVDVGEQARAPADRKVGLRRILVVTDRVDGRQPTAVSARARSVETAPTDRTTGWARLRNRRPARSLPEQAAAARPARICPRFGSRAGGPARPGRSPAAGATGGGGGGGNG